MPLFELYRMTKEKLDLAEKKNSSSSSTDLSFQPENDLVELVWENGQILMKGQSGKTRKSPTSNNLTSLCLPSHTPKTRDKDVGNGTKMGKYGTVDSVLNEILMPVPSAEMELNQYDEMVPWLNYSADETLQHEYCSDYFSDLSGVTGNEISCQNNFASFDKSSSNSNQFNREFNSVSVHDSESLERWNLLKSSSARGDDCTWPKSNASPLYTSSSQQCQTLFTYFRPRVSDSTNNSTKNSTENAMVGDPNPVSSGSFQGLKMQKQDQKMSSNKSGLMNFSHFTQPVALAKANLQTIGSIPGSGLSRLERMGSKDNSSVASCSKPIDSTRIESGCGLRKESSSQFQPIAGPSKVVVKPSETKPPLQTASVEQPEVSCCADISNNDKKPSQILGESGTKGLLAGEKNTEPVVASSSVCSGNSVERASDDHPTHNLKRKHYNTQDSECPSEDVEEESVSANKVVHARVRRASKRSRAAEVHNLSERRRRDRINEKMRALQELIPNCNKVDKASMLDEAIEYLKTLQLQVQIMSRGAGLYMPSMMFQPGMQHMHAAAHMAYYSPMGMGMGMGVGFGMGMPGMNNVSSCYPMVRVPAMHSAHFPSPPVSGPHAMQGMGGSNFQQFGYPGQGHPMSMPHSPLTLLSGGPIMKSAIGPNACGIVGPMDNLDATMGLTAKDLPQNVNSQVKQNTKANSSVNQTSSKCQATNGGFALPPGVQENCQTAEVNGHGTFYSPCKNEDESNRAVCYD